MTETQQQPARKQVNMPVGGTVMAIVPQTFEEIQRVSATVISAGIAPSSLVKYVKDAATDEEKQQIGKTNVAAVATAIMAGAELGLPPMAALRSFTVINGRPALYADGNVAVVRKAKDSATGEKIAAYIKHGFTEVHDLLCPVCKAAFPAAALAMVHFILEHKAEAAELKANDMKVDATIFSHSDMTDRSFAWCEAKRGDTGEIYMETFSIADAKTAGLWETEAIVEREVWEWSDEKRKRVPIKKMVANDSPWFRYWKRMLGWRAIGYCLRWLFADVLGGMPDEYEARSIGGDMIDVTPPPRDPTPPRLSAETVLPDVPSVDQTGDQTGPLHNSDQPAGGESEVVSHSGPSIEAENRDTRDPARDVDEHPDDYNQDDSPPVVQFEPTGAITPEVQEGLDEIAATLAEKTTEAEIEQAFDDFDVQGEYSDNQVALARAFQIREEARNALAKKQRADLEQAGQQDIFGGALPDVPEAE